MYEETKNILILWPIDLIRPAPQILRKLLKRGDGDQYIGYLKNPKTFNGLNGNIEGNHFKISIFNQKSRYHHFNFIVRQIKGRISNSTKKNIQVPTSSEYQQ